MEFRVRVLKYATEDPGALGRNEQVCSERSLVFDTTVKGDAYAGYLIELFEEKFPELDGYVVEVDIVKTISVEEDPVSLIEIARMKAKRYFSIELLRSRGSGYPLRNSVRDFGFKNVLSRIFEMDTHPDDGSWIEESLALLSDSGREIVSDYPYVRIVDETNGEYIEIAFDHTTVDNRLGSLGFINDVHAKVGSPLKEFFADDHISNKHLAREAWLDG